MANHLLPEGEVIPLSYRQRAAQGPLDAATLARGFRQGARVEGAVARILASLARLGHIQSPDGKIFSLRRAA